MRRRTLALATAGLGAAMALPGRWWRGLAASQTDPRLDELFARLADAGDPVEAAWLEQMIWAIWSEIDDPLSRDLLERGSVAMTNRQWSEARAALDALVERSPDFAEGWNKRATLFWVLDDYGRSVQDIQRTLALEPRHFGALSGLGLIFTATGQKEAAIRTFEAALEIHPFLAGARQHIERLRDEPEGAPL
jgi:tetratricopeptide (TPR) repeat protein